MSNIDALKKKTKTGLLWNSFEKISVKVASFILNIVFSIQYLVFSIQYSVFSI